MRAKTSVGVFLVLLLCHSAYGQRQGGGSDSFRKFVKALPPVDRIEVLAVTPFLAEDAKAVDCSSGDLRCKPGSFPLKIDSRKTLTGADADKLSELWRKLRRSPLHGADRCFYTDNVLRFYQGARLLLEAEVCARCRKITLPNVGMVHVVDSDFGTAYLQFQEFLMPDSGRRQGRESFKQETMPKVGRQLTVVGLLGGSKPALAVFPSMWGAIYLPRLSISEMNYLGNLGCQVVIKVTGTLRFSPEPERTAGQVAEQTVPEHFYFDNADVKVISVYQPYRLRRSKRHRDKFS